MKIAYLIIAHNNFEHLKRLIRSIQNENVFFFIHIDQKAPQISFDEFYHVQLIPEQYSIKWGGFSMVKVTIELLKYAYHFDDFNRFVLLSGVDYPIRSNEYIENLFQKNPTINYIDTQLMPSIDKPFDRLFRYYIECDRTVNLQSFPIKVVNKLIKQSRIWRAYPEQYQHYKPFAGSQWWSFSDAFVDYLLNFISTNDAFIRFYLHTFVPDEMFFQTIIMNSPFAQTVRNTLTFADWELGGPPYPSLIRKIHMDLLKNELIYSNQKVTIYCFARKFTDDSSKIVSELDKIRSNF
ncbi:beta-1,6-N-acetylglucosaminyltransferase [Sporolactobacillus kofuensis]|nr:beta-1,6-N-acetylglucosaminyltransferase [Sporolactobacillus kofuensis]MCO7176709.1 beta-1,6-N-acetylglucosaminyltransferase [Sporolactobacillus kofuensis]